MPIVQLRSKPTSRGARRWVHCLLVLGACTTNEQLSLGHHEATEDACGTGAYVAQLSCTVTNGPFGPPSPGIPGPGGPPQSMSTGAELLIEPVTGMTELADVSGDLSFTAWDSQFDARVVGQLDCATGRLQADIVGGTFRARSSPPGPPGVFVGRLDAERDALTDDLAGDWFHGPLGMPDTRCAGAWTASRMDEP
jgi:hypothetical protein